MSDDWYCFVPESTDFADKMDDYGLGGINCTPCQGHFEFV